MFYGLFALYVILLAFRSVIPQAFWPGRHAHVPQLESADCSGTLAPLEDQLLELTSTHVREGGAASAEPSLVRWDRDFQAFEEACGDSSPYHRLEQLRYATATTIARFDDEDAWLVDQHRHTAESSPRQ